MKFYGLHWTSDDGTEIQIRIEMDSLELWARACPRGGEWTAWRRLDVKRDSNNVILETVANALHAAAADNANYAREADMAKKAMQAERATLADKADYADKAGNADKAVHADNADFATNAQTAERANGLAHSLIISLTGAVTGSAKFDGIRDVEILTSAGSELAAMKNSLANLLKEVNSLKSDLASANSAIRALQNTLGDYSNRIGALEANKDAGAVTLEVLNWRTNCLQQRLTMETPNHFAGYPDWWGSRECPDYAMQQAPDNNEN